MVEETLVRDTIADIRRRLDIITSELDNDDWVSVAEQLNDIRYDAGKASDAAWIVYGEQIRCHGLTATDA